MRNPCIFLVSSLSVVIFLLLIPQGFCVEIIGGNEVIPHSRPYMVLIKIDKKQICAGALIGKNWVLTAAHCTVCYGLQYRYKLAIMLGLARAKRCVLKVDCSTFLSETDVSRCYGKINKRSEVILGVHAQDKSEPGRQIRHVKKGFIYPCYDPHTHEGDLQLLKLNKKVTTGKNINLLHLPKHGDDVKPNTVCRVAGWGSTQNKSPMSSTLREVNVTVIDRKICNDPKHYNYNPVIGLNMICAGNLKGGKDSCNGDSGSPLICDGTFKGITAFGMEGKCGTPQGPGIYTLLSKKYLNWIIETMAGAV